MKESIIDRSIAELQRNGLRFSIDEVARSLKISKKTVYKFFTTKEDLAVAIYKTFYDKAIDRIGSIEDSLAKREAATQLLTVYFQSHCMIRDDIFNKYALNDSIRALAQEGHDRIKARIREILPQSDGAALMIIIDGSMRRLVESEENAEKVIERLAMLIC